MELYVHIPFCARKCEYCSFVSFPASEVQKDAYIDAVLQEAETRKTELKESVETVYIGGGTPSLLSPMQIRRLITGLQSVISFEKCTEFSVEANPGTVTESFMETISALKVNRLSLGMQAYQEPLLNTLGRIHSFKEVEASVQNAVKYGLTNLNLDLIFGIPGQTLRDWDETLEAALSLHPVHISAYGLIPEEGTPLWEHLSRHEIILPDPDLEREMYDLALDKLKSRGLEQYEISNFAVKGFECRHNIGYWTQKEYVGLGISAASMLITEKGNTGMTCLRKTNPDKMEQYLRMVSDGKSAWLEETVTPREARFETMMLSLRMNQGIRPERFMEYHGLSINSCYGEQLAKMEKSGLMQFSDGAWSLTRRGFDIQNSILLEFMEDE